MLERVFGRSPISEFISELREKDVLSDVCLIAVEEGKRNPKKIWVVSNTDPAEDFGARKKEDKIFEARAESMNSVELRLLSFKSMRRRKVGVEDVIPHNLNIVFHRASP